MASDSLRGVNVICDVNGEYREAIAARATISALIAAGVEVAIADTAAVTERATDRRTHRSYHAERVVANWYELPHDVNLFAESPYVVGPLTEANPFLIANRTNALLPFWELARIPRAWYAFLASIDLVLAPSTFVGEAFRNGVHCRVRPVPLTPLLPELPPERFPGLPGGFVFCFAVDANGSMDRRNPGAVIAAFLNAFRGADDVHLYFKMRLPPGQLLERASIDRTVAEHPNVHFDDAELDQTSILQLARDSSARVSLHTSIGLGLGLLESMTFGRPCIATDFSGSTDYLDETTGEPVPYALVPVRSPYPRYAAAELGGETAWAEVDLSAAARALRRVVEQPERSATLAEAARARIAGRRTAFLGGDWLAPLATLAARKRAGVPAPPRLLPAAPARRASGRPVHVMLEGMFRAPLSLAHVNRELGAAFARDPELRFTGVELAAPDPVVTLDPELARCIVSAPEAAALGTPDVRVRHYWPPHLQRHPARRFVVCQPFEFGELPVDWERDIAIGVDQVWVYTNYEREIYVRAGVPEEKIVLVPLGIDPHILRPEGERAELPGARSFRFLFLGGTIGRKGIDVAIQAYLTAFGPHDDVTFVVKDIGGSGVYANMNAGDQIRDLMKRNDKAHLMYIDDTLDDAQIAALYRACDVLLLPYRGEGFGMPILEAMACGKPVIVTAGGATDDFVDESVGIRVPATRRSVGNKISDLCLVRDGWVLEPDLNSVVEALRRLAGDPALARRLGAAAAERARGWTWARSAALASAALTALARAEYG